MFIWLFAIMFPVHFPDWLGLSLFILSCFLAGFASWLVCGRPDLKPTDFTRPDYEKLGLLITEEFSVRRTFEVAEFEDEGLHFFLELNDGRVLFMNGQYLYDYQEIADDEENNQKASFPCAHFRVRRHKSEHWVHSIETLSPYLPPEVKLPHYSKSYIKKHSFPEDGKIYSEPYDTIKNEINGA
jgi:hypothetical protein